MKVILFVGLSIATLSSFTVFGEGTADDQTPRSAHEHLERMLRRENIRLGYDTALSRFVVLKSERLEMDPGSDPNFVSRRTSLERKLFLECQCNLAETVSMQCARSESASLSGNEQNKNTTSLSSKMPIIGMQILHQAESFDGKTYQMAIVAVWSKKLENSARSIMSGRVEPARPSNMKFGDRIDKIDLSIPYVQRFFTDNSGVFHVLGVGVCALDGNPAHERVAEEIARTRARAGILCSLSADCEQRVECKLSVENGVPASHACREEFQQRLLSTSGSLPVGIVEVKSGAADCPLSGKRVFVSICEVNAGNVRVWNALDAKGR